MVFGIWLFTINSNTIKFAPKYSFINIILHNDDEIANGYLKQNNSTFYYSLIKFVFPPISRIVPNVLCNGIK